jgi:regulator of nucleoside diphosphate kinase
MKAPAHDVVITDFDRRRLQGLLQVLRSRSGINSWNLDALELGLKRARTVAADAVPSDVVTMNSKVTLRDQATGECLTVTLVFPDASAQDRQRLPVLSPLGLALLGCRVGNVLEHKTSGGLRHLVIEKLEFQPEAKGNYFM